MPRTALPGILTTVGAMVSLTVTVKLWFATLPAASVAVSTTVVMPTGKVLPLVWLPPNVTDKQLSVAVGVVQLATALQLFEAAIKVIEAGTDVQRGAKTSLTVN